MIITNHEKQPNTRIIFSQAYEMSKSPRGHACIINIQQGRKGTDHDRDKMKELLEQLDFQVQVYNDEDDLSAKVKYFIGLYCVTYIHLLNKQVK